jgi:protein-tyrosine phosphatase
VFNWFRKSQPQIAANALTVDVHSHLLPGLDDGVQSFEEAGEIIQRFISLGYKKLITTPHVMSDTYRNTPELILERLDGLNAYIREKQLDISVSAAAEYYLDEDLMEKIQNNTPVLTFGENYLLFETNFLSEPLLLRDFIFAVSTRGYQPVLAHPERYIYLQHDLAKLEELLDRGVLFQINTSSLTGYYSKGAQTTAHRLIDHGWVHFIGSDCHTLHHAELAAQASTTRYFQKALTLPLRNNSLG